MRSEPVLTLGDEREESDFLSADLLFLSGEACSFEGPGRDGQLPPCRKDHFLQIVNRTRFKVGHRQVCRWPLPGIKVADAAVIGEDAILFTRMLNGLVQAMMIRIGIAQ